MNTTHRWDCIVKGTGWTFGFLESLFLIAAFLILIPRLVLPVDSGAYVLLGLYLGNWFIVVGLAGLALTAVWLLLRATRGCR